MGLTKPRAAQIFNLDYKQSTRVATVVNIALAGGAPNQVDGVNLSLNDRILVTGQTTGSQNGLYYVTTVGSGANGTWARTSDGNENGEIEAGMIVMVTEGTIYADTQWKLITDDPIIINTTALTFTQNYMANSISGGTSNVVVNSNANVTISSAGTANVVNVGNTAVTFTGNVFPSANVTYSLGNTALRWKDLWLANSTLYIGDVALATTGSALTINGANVLVGNTGSAFSTSGNVTGGNVATSGSVSATGNVTGGNIVTVGAVSTTGNAYVGNILTNGYYYANGVVFGGGGGGTPGGANTQIQFNNNGVFGGSAGLTFNNTTNAVATTGTFSATGDVTGGNLLTAGLISATGNVQGGNILTAGIISATGANSLLGPVSILQTTSNNSLRTTYNQALQVRTGLGNGTSVMGIMNESANAYSILSFIDNSGVERGAVGYANPSAAYTNFASSSYLYSAGTGGVILSANIGAAPGTRNFWITSAGLVTVPGSTAASNTATGAFQVTGGVGIGGNIYAGGLISATGAITGAALTGTSLTVSTGNITGGNLILSGAITDSGQLDISTTASNGNIVLTPNGTGNVNTGANISVTGRVTAASVVGGVITGSSVSVTGAISSSGSGTFVGLTAGSGNVAGGNISTAGLITATGNIQGGNIRTAGLISATGAITGAALTGTSLTVSTGNITGGNLILSGAITDSGQLDIRTTASNGNIVLSPNGTGNVNTGANIMPTANATANIGSAALSFNTIFAKATSAQYADLAEMYLADSEYTPGTILDFGGEQEVTATTQSHSTRVAGIVSTNPSYLMNSTLTCTNAVEVALVGRVPCYVIGTIAKGDRLVSSLTPGVATRLDMSQYQPGCIIGKALESYDSDTVGTIEVAVGRI